jgi:hypothetical protein
MNNNRLLSTLAIGFSVLSACRKPSEDGPPSAIPSRAPSRPRVAVEKLDDNRKDLLLKYLGRARTVSEESESSIPFFRQLNFVRLNYLPLDGEDLANQSRIIVSGSIEAVVPGRTIDFSTGPSHPITTAVLKVAIDKVIKAAERALGSHVYVEVYRAPVVSVEALQQAIPKEPLMLFLTEAHTDHSLHRYSGGEGVPPLETLYSLLTPQGLLIKVGGNLKSPLALESAFQSDITSFDEVETAVKPRPRQRR